MEFVLAGLQWQTCLVYLDDVIVFGRDFEEHLERLQEVFERFRQAGLKLKPSKCFLLRPRVPYLGHVISAEGVSTDPAKIRAVEQWPVPSKVSDVRSFLGLASYYRRFIEDFAEIASPLHRLTAKSTDGFQWSAECDKAFRTLKEKLVTAPILAFPRCDARFIVDCDASDYGLGAVISQEQDGSERVIAYASRVLDGRERRYSTTKKEMLAMVYAIRHFRHYLYGRPFLVRTDHNALKWLQSFKEPEGQVARWLELLAQYDYKIEHRPGRKHQNADALSRNPLQIAEETVQTVQTNVIDSSASTWVPGWTAANLQSRQVADPDLKQILFWKQNQTNQPAMQEVQGTSKATKSLWAQWNRLQLENGVLYRRWETEDGHGARLQLVLPRSMVPEVLSALHDAPSAGHMGVNKTLERVRERFYWYGQQHDVEDWCRQCQKCSKRKSPQQPGRAPLVSSCPGYPFERIALDIMGPLPTTESGQKYILVVGDYFSKWTEAFPLPNQEAKTVAEKLVNEVISRYGAPERIHTDQGRNFEAQLFKEMCTLFSIEKTRMTPYHPQSDGMVERMNRTLQDMLAKYVSDHQCDWDVHLPMVMMAYRSSVHSSTQYTPYYLLFGHEVRLPVDVMYGREPHQPEAASEYVRNLRSTLDEAHERAREHLRTAQRRQKDYYDRRVAGQEIKVGDRVYLHVPAMKTGRTKKLHSPWQGPHLVVKKISDVTFRIEDVQNRRKRRVVHFNRLKLCQDPQPADQQPDQPTVYPSSLPVRRPHLPPRYTPDETDLMYSDGTAADGDETVTRIENEVPRDAQQPIPEPIIEEVPPPVLDRPRREVRVPVWMRDFVS